MAANTQKINAKSVVKYVFLPGIVPRAKELGGEGFAYLSFLFASVFQAVRILPPNHPYVQPGNIGKFSIRQVIVAAANNIEVSRRNIDQVIVFAAILSAVILMAMQFILLVCGIFASNAYAGAGGVGWQSMFETQYPQVDIAFLMLDYVFGIPDLQAGGAVTFFGSNALQETGGPTPFHQGLHALFNFYNLALLLVGVLIFMYYVIVVVVETAQSGVPFGRRFSKLYAPFRLIFAIGMLVPFGYGFNGSQYITLYAAKLGSSFATNGWLLFNAIINEQMGAEATITGAPRTAMVARPRFPASDELMYFSSVYHACREMYAIWVPAEYENPTNGVCINAYVVHDNQAQAIIPNNTPACAAAPVAGGAGGNYTYAQAKADFHGGEVEILLGEYDPSRWAQYAGGVNPYCGKITVSMANDNPSIFLEGAGPEGGGFGPEGVRYIEQIYYELVREILRVPGEGAAGGFPVLTADNRFAIFGERSAHATVPHCRVGTGPGCLKDYCWKADELGDAAECGEGTKMRPPSEVFQDALNFSRTRKEIMLNQAYNEYRNGLDFRMTEALGRRGWGGAGILYNDISDVNGAFTGAIYAAPSVRKWPSVMEYVRSQKQAQDKSTNSCKIFEPNLADGKKVEFTNKTDIDVAKATYYAYEYFNCEKPNQDTSGIAAGGANIGEIQGTNCGAGGAGSYYGTVTDGMSANALIDIISVIFGINGLFDLRSCSEIDPATGQSIVHPLAMLSTIGKSLVENSIRSMGMALGAAFGGGMIGMLGSSMGAALDNASGMFTGIATIGLSAGFLLYYILPFLPFIYFFFAVGSWVKSIFEAMVGAPLWALAHLRIDGEGLPGSSAASGYFLIFEIFLRPIVTVFGMIGGIACFSASVAVLNNIFDQVVINVTGATPDGSNATMNIGTVDSFRRGVIDQFFFTMMYAILVYMMATSSFKMIDTIPKFVMRWLNSRVSTFNDNKEDPTQNLTRYASLGGAEIGGQIMQGARQGASGMGQAAGAFMKEAAGGGKQPGGQ